MTLRLGLRIDGDVSGAENALKKVRADVANFNRQIADDSRQMATRINSALSVKDDFGGAKRGADMQAYGKAMDEVRAKYNPLFAAQQQYKAQLAEIKQAHAVGAISADEMAAAVQRQKNAFAGQVTSIRGTTGALKLNQAQLANMQFQMNDMATMIASGQSPFVMMMQQGMQIGQIFGPGATVMQALKATGAGVIGFLTNPIMLAVGAAAVLAGGIGYVFDAFSGPEAKSAEDTLADINDLLSQMKAGYADVGDLAKDIIDAPLSAPRLQVRLEIQKETAEEQLEQTINGLQKSAEGLSINWLNFTDDLEETHDTLRGMLVDLAKGEMSGTDFADAIAAMQLDPSLSENAREAVGLFTEGADEADRWARNVRGIELAIDQASGKILNLAEKQELAFYKLAQGLRKQTFAGFDADGALGLRDQYNKEQESTRREAERAAGKAEREAERAARESARNADQRAANALLLSDLEAEIAALSLVGDEREAALAQLKEEQELRAAINSLGNQVTAEEISRLQQLIPLKNDLLDASRRQEEQMRREEQSARSLASGIASVGRQLIEGKDAGELFSGMLVDMGFKLLESGLMAMLAGGASPLGGGPLNLLSLLFSARGNVFSGGEVMAFANGGAFTNQIVSSPTFFPMANGAGVMGEAGPEAIMPLKRGSDGRLGISAHGGQTSGIQVSLSPDLEARVLSRAHNQSIAVVKQAAPTIAGQGARQGEQLARASYAKSQWQKR